MAALPTLISELKAVNVLLHVIGESPVNRLDDANVVDVVMARAVLDEVSNAMQSEGWHFNTEKDYPLSPNLEGEILLPANCVRVDLDVWGYPDKDVVQRGQRLYDRKKHSYRFDRTLKAEVVLLLPFEELPEVARRYVTIRAARVFQARMVGSQVLDGFSENDELQAKSALREAEGDTADHSIFNSFDVARVLMR